MKATTYYASTLNDLSIIVIALLMLRPTFATKKSSYVVYMGAHTNRAQVTSADITQSHYDFLGSFLGSADKAKYAILYSYNNHINGFAAIIEDDVADQLSQHPMVVSVFLSQRKKLHTTRSWNFLVLENNNGQIPVGSLWEKARFGEDVIIGHLDTGVWPESKSFSGEGMGPIPSKWRGICQNDHDTTFRCNRGESLSDTSLQGKKLYPLLSSRSAKAANATAEEASPMAFITKPITELGTKPSPIMAAFSSVGPNSIIPEILKPDITAPGVSIIAAYTQARGPTYEDFDSRHVEFNSMSGTSMSCPHIAGVVGLLKTLHPDWSNAAIKSAIMTTGNKIQKSLMKNHGNCE
ncbi:hypothetical protein CASFOL_002474 [Castilleja foliolosa]|uniref:Uncharacterized protein n=1 Tax=Castilleja foliolosa TaxID=1961234 RepID=A0ABD3EEE9_9LAMI